MGFSRHYLAAIGITIPLRSISGGKFMRAATILLAWMLVSTMQAMAQSPCGAFSCEYYRQQEQNERNLDMMFLEDRMRQQQYEQQRRAERLERRLQEMQRRQENPNYIGGYIERMDSGIPR